MTVRNTIVELSILYLSFNFFIHDSIIHNQLFRSKSLKRHFRSCLFPVFCRDHDFYEPTHYNKETI